ncbi:MAG TPA: transposase [Pyrinomonadaceae bacterium]|jgi:REP element-mobilizing transposase RayT|nr:transposase [Pyrinomonadaceae bacterium]
MIPKHERIDEFGYEVWEKNVFPLVYLITFRTFGTWLHGDERTAVKRDGWNIYGTQRIQPNERLEKWMLDEMKQDPFVLTGSMRTIVETSVIELCQRRSYGLGAVNVRTNHVHAVVSAAQKPERISDALKSNATKFLRDAGLIGRETRVWSRGRSRRYLWKPRHVQAATEYTLYGQGDFVIPD